MFSVSSETLWDVHGVCALWVLIDSAPEPMNRNMVTTRADVLNVAVVHSMGLIEDLGSVGKPSMLRILCHAGLCLGFLDLSNHSW